MFKWCKEELCRTSLRSAVRWYPFLCRMDQAISVSFTFIWHPYVSKYTETWSGNRDLTFVPHNNQNQPLCLCLTFPWIAHVQLLRQIAVCVTVLSICSRSLWDWNSFEEILETWTRGYVGLELPLSWSNTAFSHIGAVSGSDPVLGNCKQGS